jgi:hypothetical protein
MSVFAAMCLLIAGIDPNPRYVFINKAPGIEWNAGVAETFTRAGFDEIANTLAVTPRDDLRLGVSFVFDFLRYDLNAVTESLERFLALSEESAVPVLVNLDGMNWWEARPDLWNWWDPALPGFDPGNRENVEWTDWGSDHAVKIGWRNWGSQIRVLPMMNMASPRVIAAHQEALGRLLPIIAAWHANLPKDRKWLLGGVKLGHEASVSVNAFYYPGGNDLLALPEAHDPVSGRDNTQGWHGGTQPLGYAAAFTGGIKTSGELTREDIGRLVHDYLALLCAEAEAAGLPRESVYTHQGGTYDPWDKNLPWSPAINAHSLPGYSLYGVDPAQTSGLTEALDASNGRWAAAEWWWGAPDAAGWQTHFEKTLGFRDCRFIAVYNWNCGYRFKETPAAHEGLRSLFATWPVRAPASDLP